MSTLNKLFLNPITEEKRKVWMEAIGIGGLQFNYREYLPGGLLLRNFEISGLNVKADLTNGLVQKELPTVTVNHPELFPIQNTKNALTVFESLITHPWILLFSEKAHVQSLIEISDPQFEKGCEEILQSLKRIEEAIQGFEVVRIECSGKKGVFLFHTVRGHIIRSAFCPENSHEAFDRGLGIASLVTLKFGEPKAMNLLSFDAVLESLSNGLENRDEKRFFSSPTPPSSLEFQFEL